LESGFAEGYVILSEDIGSLGNVCSAAILDGLEQIFLLGDSTAPEVIFAVK